VTSDTNTSRFEYEEKRQQVADIEMMIADFTRLANDLDHQIKVEQQASGISDVSHYAYPTFARAAMARRDNLRSSIAGLEERLGSARNELADAYEQLKIAESAGGLEAQRQVKSGGRKRPQRGIGAFSGGR